MAGNSAFSGTGFEPVKAPTAGAPARVTSAAVTWRASAASLVTDAPADSAGRDRVRQNSVSEAVALDYATSGGKLLAHIRKHLVFASAIADSTGVFGRPWMCEQCSMPPGSPGGFRMLRPPGSSEAGQSGRAPPLRV